MEVTPFFGLVCYKALLKVSEVAPNINVPCANVSVRVSRVTLHVGTSGSFTQSQQ